MNMERQLREEERIRAGYYQQHNSSIIILGSMSYSQKNTKICYHVKLMESIYRFTRFILKIIGQTLFDLKKALLEATVIPVLLQCSPLRWFIPT